MTTWFSVLREQPALLWRFFGIFLKGFLRNAHAGVITLVLWQFLTSSGVSFKPGSNPLYLWLHVAGGLGTVLLGSIFVAASLKARGLKDFFPYLWGDTSALEADIKKSLKGKLLSPHPMGLASSVQGLGMGALLLVAYSGLTWFGLWLGHASTAHLAREIHKNLTPLIILYFIGHGSMASIHFIWWQRHLPKKHDA